MIKYYCDVCDEPIKEPALSTLQLTRAFWHAPGVYKKEAHLCPTCALRALNPILEAGKKYRARDSHGNVGEVEIAEITVMKEGK